LNEDMIINDNESELDKLVEQRDKLQYELQDLCEAERGEEDYHDYEQDESSLQSRIGIIVSQIERNNARIGEIHFNQGKELYKQEYDEKIVNYSRGSVISDLTNTEDIFNRRERAKTIAQIITDKSTQAPFNIGIFARWGEGKTTFLSFLQEELERLNRKEENNNSEKFETYVVNYDASEYEEKDKIWASILRAMFLQYEKSTWFPKYFYMYKKFVHNKKKYSAYIFSYILSLLIVCVLSAYSINALRDNMGIEWKIITASGSTIMAVIILISKLLIPSVKGLLQSAVPLSDKIVNNIALPDYVDKLGERENIKTDLSILVEAWLHRGKNKDSRIVLIIDELDRCSEKGILEFFQSMQLFLKVPELITIFAIDQEFLKKALSSTFVITGMKEANKFLLREYLDKYISMPIYLDTQVDYLTYIEHLLKISIIKESFFALSEGEKESVKSVIETIPISFLTPRKVKKIVNVLLVSKETCVIFNENKQCTEIIDFRSYILWFVFSYFYEEAVKQMLIDFKQSGKYYSIKKLLSEMPKENRDKLMANINNQKIIKLIHGIVLKDIYNYQSILSGFARTI